MESIREGVLAMRRLLVLGLLLAPVVGCESGTPEPTLYAPDDLASVLPQRTGDLTLEVDGSGGSEYLTETLGEDALTALTRCHNNAPCHPDRLHVALASSSGDTVTPGLVVFAARVEDVSAWDLGPGGGGLSLPADLGYARHFAQDIATPGEGWLLFYPYGEVLFGAISTSDALTVASDDVVAAFPSCRQKDEDYVQINCLPPRP